MAAALGVEANIPRAFTVSGTAEGVLEFHALVAKGLVAAPERESGMTDADGTPVWVGAVTHEGAAIVAAIQANESI